MLSHHLAAEWPKHTSDGALLAGGRCILHFRGLRFGWEDLDQDQVLHIPCYTKPDPVGCTAHQLNADGFGGGVGDAELAGDDDGGEGEGAAHVDGAVVGGHGRGALAREQLRDQREADRVLRRLRRCKAHAQQQQLVEARHLKRQPGDELQGRKCHT